MKQVSIAYIKGKHELMHSPLKQDTCTNGPAGSIPNQVIHVGSPCVEITIDHDTTNFTKNQITFKGYTIRY